MQVVVLDTNIALDVLLFADAAAQPLRTAVQSQQVQWLATARMREELARVLRYPQIAKRAAFYQRTDADILGQYDACAQIVEPAAACPMVCRDPDDQVFIDLAVAHHAQLISKDDHVLRMRKRLLKGYGVVVTKTYVPDTMAVATASATLMPSTAADKIPPA